MRLNYARIMTSNRELGLTAILCVAQDLYVEALPAPRQTQSLVTSKEEDLRLVG